MNKKIKVTKQELLYGMHKLAHNAPDFITLEGELMEESNTSRAIKAYMPIEETAKRFLEEPAIAGECCYAVHTGLAPCRRSQAEKGECPCDKDEARRNMCKPHYDAAYAPKEAEKGDLKCECGDESLDLRHSILKCRPYSDFTPKELPVLPNEIYVPVQTQEKLMDLHGSLATLVGQMNHQANSIVRYLRHKEQ